MRLDAALAQHKIHIITLPSGYSSSSYDREKGSRIISSRAAAAAAAARRTSARRRCRRALSKSKPAWWSLPHHYYILGSGSHHSYDYRTNYYPTWNYEWWYVFPVCLADRASESSTLLEQATQWTIAFCGQSYVSKTIHAMQCGPFYE